MNAKASFLERGQILFDYKILKELKRQGLSDTQFHRNLIYKAIILFGASIAITSCLYYLGLVHWIYDQLFGGLFPMPEVLEKDKFKDQHGGSR